MPNLNSKFMLTAVMALGVGLAFSTVRADVQVKSVTHFGGIAGMGASDMTSVSYLQFHKKRTEINIKFTGAMLGTLQKLMSHGQQDSTHINIYLVDQNKQFELNPGKKTYIERSIYSPPQPGEISPPPSSAGEPHNPRQREQSDTRVVKSEVNVRDTGKTRVINGFNTHNYEVTWDVETENVKTKERGRSLMSVEMWNSTEPRFEKMRQEENTYARAYVRLLHLPEMYGGLNSGQLGLNYLPFASAQGEKELFHKLEKIKGYPVITDVKWEGGCISNCSNDNQTQPQQTEDSGGSGNLGGMLGALLGGKTEQQSQEKNAGGLNTIFTSHTELQSIDTSSLPASLFQVPAGYSKE
jgi:hypothetical protein